MRPVRLELSGFGAFREPTTVDFEGADFFALVGPTGSGKSTVIDAVCFALYGSVPRYDDRRLIAPIVTMGALEAKVSLLFDVGGERYIAARVVRRTKTGATTPEARLERVRDGEVLAGRANEMEAAVEQVLGLPFAHFTKSVVLPQGEFARFLHDKPAERQQLLVELLNLGVYTRMGQEARALAARKEAEVALHTRRLEELAELATDAHKRAVEQRVGGCGRLATDLQSARIELDALTKAGDDAEREAQHAGALVALLRLVNVPREVSELARQKADAEAALATAGAGVTETTAVAAQRARELAAQPDLAVLLSVRDAHRDLAALGDEIEKTVIKLAEAEKLSVDATARMEAAEARRAEALAAQEALRTEHRAHAVAITLHAGDTCPVCNQTIATLPKRSKPAGVDRVDRDVERAKKEHEQVVRRREQAAIAVESTRKEIAALRRREGDLVKRVGAHADAAVLDALVETVQEAQRALETARRADDAARTALDRARAAADSFEGRMKQAAAQFRAQRDPLLQHGAELPEPHDDLLDDWNRLASFAAGAAEASEEEARAARERLDAAQAERRKLLVDLAESCGALDIAVESPITLDRLIEGAVRAENDAKHELTAVKAAITEVKKLRKAVGAAIEEAAVAKSLGSLLRASEFERWLVTEALDVLISDASRTLEDLSAGQYSLAFDDTSRDFLVVDHRNADERRSVRTLSGGETFQASLALALALSDQLRDLAADGAARLESIFLDEGFGSLDPDTLETVASTIETLAVGDRMVGLITHVAELSDRVPVRFVVAKGPRTATVEKVLA
jgi:exonuclease SbcC